MVTGMARVTGARLMPVTFRVIVPALGAMIVSVTWPAASVVPQTRSSPGLARQTRAPATGEVPSVTVTCTLRSPAARLAGAVTVVVRGDPDQTARAGSPSRT